MPLRSPSNPTRDSVVMGAMALVAPGYPTPNTAIALNSSDGTGVSVIYVEREYDLLNNGVFPAVLIQAGTQGYTRMSRSTYNGQLTVLLDYYDRYDQRPTEFDVIRASIRDDLELIKSNLEANETLVVSNVALTVSLLHSTLSPYAGILRDFNTLKLVYRRLSITYNLLDYDTSS
jgi:hypothetical protein